MNASQIYFLGKVVGEIAGPEVTELFEEETKLVRDDAPVYDRRQAADIES